MKVESIEEIKDHPIVGNYYIVPCLEYIVNNKEEIEEDFLWRDLKNNKYKQNKRKLCIPIINFPHSDSENGQDYIHYHADTRFIDNKLFFDLSNEDILRPKKIENSKVIYRTKLCVHEKIYSITNSIFIKNTKLKHKCIYNGKCPHKGYDLSNVIPESNIITCPLHGLKFSKETGILIK